MGPEAVELWSSDGVCAIIDACARSKVKLFTIGDLRVEFFGTEAPVWGENLGVQATARLSADESYVGTGTEIPNTKISQVDRNLLDEARRSQLLVNDPVSFEQEMIDEQMRSSE